MELARGQFRGQRPDQTLQPTALVHEVYLKMAEGNGAPPRDHDHLLAVAATAMRQVLIDHARGRGAQKRGGGWARMTLSDVSTPSEEWDVLELDEAIHRLANIDERQARIVELRFFGGLSGEQTARVLGVSERTQQRDARIIELCAGNDALRDAVVRLLDGQSHADTHWGLDEVSVESHPEIPGYRITGVLGEGGMGTVYRAEQLEPRREVALKVIRGGLVTDQIVRRFRREAEVLARLSHPGIAPVHAVGIAGAGRRRIPFIAMELVDGESLTSYAQIRSLGTRERLGLIADVCDAVGHAHERGVIHRDLKPANILVDASGRPRVLDFGIARLTEHDVNTQTLRTEAGQLLGTASHMSPEQAAGDPSAIDERSDVYALGVVMFELLTGRLPHDTEGMGVLDALRVIREDEHTRLRSINATLGGEVETITGKSLEKEPERRYASPGAMAADIRRFLANQPILAHPPSTVYQLRKFARRNRALVGGVVAVIVTLAGGLVATGFALTREAGARRAAERNAERVEAINSFLLKDLFYAVDSADLGPEATLTQLVDRAAPRIPERFGDDADMLARVYALLGVMRTKLVRYPDAIESFSASVEALPDAIELTQLQRAEIYADRAHAYRYNGQFDEAESDLAKAMETLYPDGDPDWEAYAKLAALQAMLHQNRDRHEEAERFYEIAMRGYEREDGADPRHLGAVISQRIAMLASLQRYEEVYEHAGTLIQFADRLSGKARTEQRHAGVFWRLRALTTLGRAVEAADLVPDLLSGFVELYGSGSAQHGSVLQLAGHVYRQAGRLEEAADSITRSIPMMEVAYGPHHYEVEKAYGMLKDVLERRERDKEFLDVSTRHKLLRLYVAGPGEGDSVRQASREAAELLGIDAWRTAMIGEFGSLEGEHPKRARFGGYVCVALDAIGDETVDLVELCLDASTSIRHAERHKEVAELFERECLPLVRARGTPADVRKITLAVQFP
eukprot:g5837.t1